jgi:hypothetical protein
MTLRYENRDRPVTISSGRPSARALRSSWLPVYLKGSTATRKLSRLVAPEASPDAGRAGSSVSAGAVRRVPSRS